MFGEIFSLKNILILIGVILTMSVVMNSFGKTTGTKADDTFSNVEKFTTSDVKEMFEDVKKIKSQVNDVVSEVKKLTEKINPTLKKIEELKKKKSKKEEDISSEEENKEEKKNERKKNTRKRKQKFEEKFTGYNSEYGKDFLLLDD